ncbi:winged helix-turn-helix transcriptional regulator [Inconstantimicrobium mannanitabidum]|uniref:Transcriptional regulator n=1 Tax=Inconstantimicrobium mannanitabidum TaxID=1604901 RepID=A0ACB5RDZ4_9CLOT|nr:helix-turn-helix domain-containing protein [Clostridium sp. TW13]GKX67493.1 transcriptional regulator [Clostridium sp. TW13]
MGVDKDFFGICPYSTSQKIFSGKWNIVIMHLLSEKSYRFGELQRALGGITQTTLTKQLRFLEEYKMIHRKVYQEIPPKVEYSLTDIGKEFLPVLKEFQIFGDKYIDFLSKDK